MLRMRFPNSKIEKKALAFLIGRFDFKIWASGETLVPETALRAMAVAGIVYTVEGPATYEQNASTMRNPSAA